MNIDTTKEPPINPLTDSGKIYIIARRAFHDELEARQKNTWRSVAQAIWHGITVAQAEIWKVMGWSK